MLDPDIISTLASTKVFTGFSREQIIKIAELGKVETIPPKQTILDENWPNNVLHIILDGKVKVVLPAELDEKKIRMQEVQLAVLSKGDCLGEYSMIDKKPTSARVITMQETRVMKISNTHLEAIIRNDAHVGMTFYKNLLKIVIEHSRTSNKNKDIFLLPWG